MIEKVNFEEMNKGLQTAFIDSQVNSSLAYRPQFVSNNYAEGKRVLASLEDELRTCDAFFFSVAFITNSGITPLKQIFQELEKKGIPGRIITTDYLNFTEPKALLTLNELSNIELKMYITNGELDSTFDASTGQGGSYEGFHTKGYIFKKGQVYRIIVGSSNMTQAALTKNKEWNTRIVSTSEGEYAQTILDEYEQLWNSPNAKTFSDFYDQYKAKYDEQKVKAEIIKKQKKLALEEGKETKVIDSDKYKLTPNSMQVGFVTNLKKIWESGEDRALLISSTGTGKSLASAFAMRELNFKKVLFVVHRNLIVRQAKDAFERVFAGTKTMGIYSGVNKDEALDKDFIFTTNMTLKNDENLYRFEKDHFDAIVLDEAHHSSAGTYQKILDYFTPKFVLGMTATPDKREENTDLNVYEIYNYNIAYEIRLQQAMEEDLLCPFHYFGITDLEIEGQENDDEADFRDFNYLTSDTRVKYVMNQAKYYGYSGNRVKGLIFVSRIEEGRELSKKFNEAGWRTMVLTGEDDDEKVRQPAIDRLVMDEEYNEKGEGQLDYIITRDIFSEGVDIPEVNQVIMLRPTESPIVFIQQLGRGLRKYDGKEFVVVLDFIGNYKNNFMIPIALSGDRTYNKDNVRRYVMEGNRIIPGASTLHFDEISKKKIFAAIDTANFSDIKLIKENYTNLKNKLGRIPDLADFDKYGEMDVLRIFDNKSLGSYYKFLVKYEKEYDIRLSEAQEKVIQFVSTKLANGKRIDELVFLRNCLKYRHGLVGRYADEMKREYGREISKVKMNNVINMLTNEFPQSASKVTYDVCVFLKPENFDKESLRVEFPADGEMYDRLKAYAELFLGKGQEYAVNDSFVDMLSDDNFYRILDELLEFGISRYQRDYSNYYRDTDLVLYQKYTYEDACRLLNWEHNVNAQNIGGYMYEKVTNTYPVFINYEKSDDIVASQNYEDRFVDNRSLISISKSKRKVSSKDVQGFLNCEANGTAVHLFVRKNKDDKMSKEFYYLGQMIPSGKTKEFMMANTNMSAVEIGWNLATPVREDIYEYIVS